MFWIDPIIEFSFTVLLIHTKRQYSKLERTSKQQIVIKNEWSLKEPQFPLKSMCATLYYFLSFQYKLKNLILGQKRCQNL